MSLRRLTVLTALALATCAPRAWCGEPRTISAPMAVPARQDSLREPNARKHLAFTPAPLERCDYWIVMESAASQVNIEANDWLDDHLVRNSFGVMKNVTPNRSIGGSLDLWWLQGTIAVAPTVRARQWFGRRQSVEGSAGWVLNDRDGAVGPIACVRYSPLPAMFVEGGVCRVAVESYQWNLTPPYGSYHRYAKSTRAFGGVGLAGAGGAVVWVVEAGAIVVLGMMLMGMDD